MFTNIAGQTRTGWIETKICMSSVTVQNDYISLNTVPEQNISFKLNLYRSVYAPGVVNIHYVYQ